MSNSRVSRGVFPALPRLGLILLSTVFFAVANSQSLSALQPDEGALLKAFEDEEGKFLGSVESAKGVISGKIRAEVEVGLTQARKKLGANAESAKHDLQLLLENVERAVDLEADIRAQLRDQIESALKAAGRRELEESEKRANNEEARAAALEGCRPFHALNYAALWGRCELDEARVRVDRYWTIR